MSYQFDLKGSQLFLLLGGLVLVGGLLFLVGMLVGVGSSSQGIEIPQTEGTDPGMGDGSEAGQALGEQSSGGGREASPAAVAAIPLPRASDPRNQKRIYELQLSAHLDEAGSAPVIENLSSANLQPYVVESKDSRDRTLYTVRLGPWDSMAEAAEAARTFREHSELDAYDPVIRHRPKPMAAAPGMGSDGTG